MHRTGWLIGIILGLSWAPLWAGDIQQQIDKAHEEVWKRFVDEHNIVLDYANLDGSYPRPTPEECREMRPSALSWGVPVEDGPMFNGQYLDGLCCRWRLTGKPEHRAAARRLIDGLLFLSSVGQTPGYIARGVATDGQTTYPMGSNDQTLPWLYGVWRYIHDGLAVGPEREELVGKFVGLVQILEQHGWRMPCNGPPSQYRGSFMTPTWEGAPRLLFVMLAMHDLTGDAKWRERYQEAAQEKVGKSQRTRLEICRTGMEFDPAQGARHSWTGSEGVISLRALWELETDPDRRSQYAEGLLSSAQLSAKSLDLCEKFEVDSQAVFNPDWRVMNEVWRPQHSEADAVAVANAGLRVQSRASPRLHQEKDFMREPLFACWVVTLCPDREFVMQQRPAILKAIAHYQFDKLHLSQFFPAESAWYRLQLLEQP